MRDFYELHLKKKKKKKSGGIECTHQNGKNSRSLIPIFGEDV